MPVAEIRPTVGLRPTSPVTEEGQVTEPSVSVPTASGAYRAATATPEPELDPQAVRCGFSGFTASPPTALQPLLDQPERMLAHSDRFALAMTMSPASASLSTTGALRLRRL